MSLKELEQTSYLSGSNAAYLEELYELYLVAPQEVPAEYQQYFASLPNVGDNSAPDVSHQAIRDALVASAKQPATAAVAAAPKQEQVDNLITAYRRFGFINADLDPIKFFAQKQDERLSLAYHGLTQADLNDGFQTRGVLKETQASLKEIFERLQHVYSGVLAIEYDYVLDEQEHNWLQNYAEQKWHQRKFSKDEKLFILKRLIASEGLEHYLGNRFVGQKRFSIEGGESTIPFLDAVINGLSEHKVREVLIGMAHRGRLNVQLNIMGKPPHELFDEFEGKKDYGLTTSDVKYHMGYSSDIKTPFGDMHLALGFNPSHLEAINPVVMGSTRARQDKEDYGNKNYASLILIHGDAAFAGQGIVQETLTMSKARGYDIGGTIHLILNNQIGFTTSNLADARTSRHSSDVAKMIEAPVIHVNGDHPEAVVRAAQLALDYHAKFQKDIVINLMCYRRFGHNEGDEPSATQPGMYKIIRAHKTQPALYADQLIKEGLISADDFKKFKEENRQALEDNIPAVELEKDGLSERNITLWKNYIGQQWTAKGDTSFPMAELKKLGEQISTPPADFNLQRQVGNMVKARAKMAAGEQPLDWGFAENLAYATLLSQGTTVRISGEDVRRGTFAHRHAVYHDVENYSEWCPLSDLTKNPAHFEIYDSVLSEYGVMGFEYGYASFDPKALVIWEAQFGDFANGAQIMIDQFITSGWQKWQRLCGLVLLLPHGQEAMGPEHSSARLERYLQLAAQDNIQICVPTTPAQIFHLLRRQVIRPYRRPLIIMSPKSVLRHKLATSTLEELADGEFKVVIDELDDLKADKVKRVVVCTGKVYYDLLEKRREESINDIAIIRVEQLYPFPYDAFKEALHQYKNAKEVVWCQEEPKNQGAWHTGRHRIEECLLAGQTLGYAGREAMAAPAPGYPALHKKQQASLVEQALDLES